MPDSHVIIEDESGRKELRDRLMSIMDEAISNSHDADSAPFNKVTITNSTLSLNAADMTGGAINNAGEMEITASTISDNSADLGGGIRNASLGR